MSSFLQVGLTAAKVPPKVSFITLGKLHFRRGINTQSYYFKKTEVSFAEMNQLTLREGLLKTLNPEMGKGKRARILNLKKVQNISEF